MFINLLDYSNYGLTIVINTDFNIIKVRATYHFLINFYLFAKSQLKVSLNFDKQSPLFLVM